LGLSRLCGQSSVGVRWADKTIVVVDTVAERPGIDVYDAADPIRGLRQRPVGGGKRGASQRGSAVPAHGRVS